MDSQIKETPRILPKKLRSLTLDYFDKLSYLFINLKFSPNTLSVLGLIAGLGVGLLFSFEKPFWAGVFIIICGIFDILDGKVAVNSSQKSLYGSIFDSTLDRYSEFFIYLGLAVHFRAHWALWVIFFAFLGSTMVSYTRARAEGLGIECNVGIMQRAERIVFLSAGAILGSLFKIFDASMITVLGIIALFSNFTTIQRTLYVRKVEKLKKQEKEV
jgi:CDP-diacylglycerol--glycerol-3-phosphate 3-phosphatidyltransferase